MAKMDEIRFIAGPIIQRYRDKLEAERQEAQKARDEAEAAKRAAEEAAKQADEAAKRSQEAAKAVGDMTSKEESGAATQANAAEAGTKSDPVDLTSADDVEMKDAETVKPDVVEEPAEGGKA